MSKPSIVFFGSFLEYSATVLKKLHTSDAVEIMAVVTTPPRPAGRKQTLTKTHVHQYAESHNIPVFTPEKLNNEILQALTSNLKAPQPDFLVVAGYGKLLPQSWLDFPKIAPINIHFSLLPKYRGAMPGEWAIIMDEAKTGISLIEMSPKLDAGAIYAQASYKIKSEDTRESLYKELYELGAKTFLNTVSSYLAFKKRHPKLDLGSKSSKFTILNPCPRQAKQVQNDDEQNQKSTRIFLPPRSQPPKTEHLYARLLNKDDSYIPWELISLALEGKSVEEISDLTQLMQELPSKILAQDGLARAIERMVRGLYGWPGVWTKVETEKGKKRLKIHTASIKSGKLTLEKVQLEGETSKDYDRLNIF